VLFSLLQARGKDVAGQDNKVQLIFVINGVNFPLEVNLNELLGAAVARALGESGNSGRPPSEWQVRDANGVLLETQRQLKDFGFSNGTRLFLSLAVGAGGADRN
jgi:uncharacterized protein DUF2604